MVANASNPNHYDCQQQQHRIGQCTTRPTHGYSGGGNNNNSSNNYHTLDNLQYYKQNIADGKMLLQGMLQAAEVDGHYMQHNNKNKSDLLDKTSAQKKKQNANGNYLVANPKKIQLKKYYHNNNYNSNNNCGTTGTGFLGLNGTTPDKKKNKFSGTEEASPPQFSPPRRFNAELSAESIANKSSRRRHSSCTNNIVFSSAHKLAYSSAAQKALIATAGAAAAAAVVRNTDTGKEIPKDDGGNTETHTTTTTTAHIVHTPTTTIRTNNYNTSRCSSSTMLTSMNNRRNNNTRRATLPPPPPPPLPATTTTTTTTTTTPTKKKPQQQKQPRERRRKQIPPPASYNVKARPPIPPTKSLTTRPPLPPPAPISKPTTTEKNNRQREPLCITNGTAEAVAAVAAAEAAEAETTTAILTAITPVARTSPAAENINPDDLGSNVIVRNYSFAEAAAVADHERHAHYNSLHESEKDAMLSILNSRCSRGLAKCTTNLAINANPNPTNPTTNANVVTTAAAPNDEPKPKQQQQSRPTVNSVITKLDRIIDCVNSYLEGALLEGAQLLENNKQTNKPNKQQQTNKQISPREPKNNNKQTFSIRPTPRVNLGRSGSDHNHKLMEDPTTTTSSSSGSPNSYSLL